MTHQGRTLFLFSRKFDKKTNDKHGEQNQADHDGNGQILSDYIFRTCVVIRICLFQFFPNYTILADLIKHILKDQLFHAMINGG
ncbi:hypothetical protein AS030_16925 [Fictibacillus enclensis]|uniref:Uncharacterized protein n=1 Tax=Fictibacillus enclensis TaxID=1017270 RepID=A0A0V8J4A3_9BACL|nr:hypothetical protein AS030_16925 [Fictibacillus enclensis]